MPNQKGVFSELLPSQQLIAAILLWIACLGFSSLCIQYIHDVLGIQGVARHIKSLQHNDIAIMRFTQIASTILGFLLPSLLYGFLITYKPFGYFSLISDFDLKWLFMAVVLILSIYPLVGLLAEMNGKISFPDGWSALEKELIDLEKLAKEYVVAFMDDKSATIFIINLFMIAIIPAICEEFFFRGVIQRISYKVFGNFHLAVLFSAFFFAFSHFEFYTFLPRIALGLLLGYMYYYSGSLVMPIFTHLLNNAMAVIALYITVLRGQSITMEVQESIPLYLVIISTVGFVVVYFYFVQSSKSFREKNTKKSPIL